MSDFNSTFKLSDRGTMVLKGTTLTKCASGILVMAMDLNRQHNKKHRVRIEELNKLASRFMSLPPLTQTIGKHLFSGKPISQRIAAELYRCRSVSSRICELSALGWRINKTTTRDPTGQRFVLYSFDGFSVNGTLLQDIF